MSSTDAHARLATRDLTLDVARVTCVLLVVVVHLLFTGVGRGPGGIVVERTAELQPWFAAASWFGEVMPLFFVVGGFASMAGWRSTLRRGEGEEQFVRARLARLARPALPVFVFFTVVLGAAALLGVDAAFLDTVAIGVGSPLWFLAAYMLVQALAPRMIRLHETHPVASLAVLVGAAIVIDAVRFTSGIEAMGLPNVAVVWLAVQQLGFWMHDGWFARRRAWQLVLLAASGYAILVPATMLVGYSWNMLSNQYPPTVPLIVLGAVQAALLTLLKRPLTALMSTRAARGAVFVIGSRLMTVYLWHLPVIMILIGVQLLLPIPMPAPGSAAWWWSRIPMLVLVLGAVWLLSLWLVRYERMPEHVTAPVLPGRATTALAVVLFVAPPFLIMVFGLDLVLAALGVVCTTAALWLTRGKRAQLIAL